jgi:hypothetical protein
VPAALYPHEGSSRSQDHIAVGRIRSIEKSDDRIGNRTRDLPACSIVPQLTTLPRVPRVSHGSHNKQRLCLQTALTDLYS